MAKLKLDPGALADDKPVKRTVRLPGSVDRDLLAYADVMASDTGQKVDPDELIGPMLARFMATDRAFRKARRTASRAPQSHQT